MPKTLSKDEVLALARLAKLHLSDEEIAQYQKELGEILDYVEQLSDVDTEGLQPTSQVTGLENVTREDKVKDMQATADDLLQVAPQSNERYIQVKRML